MGNLCSANQDGSIRPGRNQPNPTPIRGEPAMDSSSDDARSDNPTLQFQIWIRIAKARNLSVSGGPGSGCSPYVRGNWGAGGSGSRQLKTPKVDRSFNPRWNFELEFTYQCKLNDLQSRTLDLEVLSHRSMGRSDELLGAVSVNLFDVATGPVLFDLPLVASLNSKVRSESGSRLSFNVKMDQIATTRVHLQSAVCELLKPFDGVYFLRYARGDETGEQCAVTERTSLPAWFSEDATPSSAIPPIYVTGPAGAALKDNIHIQLRCTKHWLKHLCLEVPNEDSDGWLIAECWLPVNQLYSMKPVGEMGPKVTQVQVSQELFYTGQTVGTLNCTVSVFGRPRLLQRARGCYTEEGLLTATPILWRPPSVALNPSYNSYSESRSSGMPDLSATVSMLPRGIRKLMDLFPQIEALDSTMEQAPRLLVLTQTLELLSTTTKSSHRSFMYQNHHGLRIAQDLLIKVLQTVLSKISVLPRDRESLHAIVFGIITRGELDVVALRMCLLSMGEARSQDQQFVLVYRATLFDTLRYVCELLNQPQVATVLRLFCIHVLTVLSFRLPRLQSMLLSDVLSDHERDSDMIPEWRNIEWRLEEAAREHSAAARSTHAEFGANRGVGAAAMAESSNSLILGGGVVIASSDSSNKFTDYEEMSLMEEDEVDADESLWWSRFWTKMLEDVPEEDLEEQELRGAGRELFAPTARWRRRMATRGECFCMLLQEWAAHVYNRNIALMQQPQWKSIHGYPIFIKAFLLSMKAMPVERMSPQIFWCASSLLKNPSLIKIFTQVILGRTNLHSTIAIMTALDEIGEWMSTLESTAPSPNSTASPYSTSFDWALLVKALALALSSDHFAVLSATIAFVFNHIHKWPPGPRNVIARELMFNRYFLKLFGHWEAQVRRAFLRLVVYRFLRISNSNSGSNLGQTVNKIYRDGICTVETQYKTRYGHLKSRRGSLSPLGVVTVDSANHTEGKSFSADSLSTLAKEFGAKPFNSGFPKTLTSLPKGRFQGRSLSVENLCELEVEEVQPDKCDQFEWNLSESEDEDASTPTNKMVFPECQSVYIGYSLQELKEILMQARKAAMSEETVPTMRFKRQESKLWNNDATLVLEGGEDQDANKTRNQDIDVEGPLELKEEDNSEW